MNATWTRELRKFIAPEIIFGVGARALAGRQARGLSATKVLLVTDPGVQAAGWAAQAEASLREAGMACVVFNQVTPNPKDHEVMAGAEVCQREHCDLILAVGGGSPMDCAKGIGLVAASGQHVLKFAGVDEVLAPGPPLICIPTTAGTGADVSPFAIITDTAQKVKIVILSRMLVPDIAMVDPVTTTTMPPALTAATGMDALCHACEAYVSNISSPMTDVNALEAVRLVAENLAGVQANPDDLNLRAQVMMGSHLAGIAFSNASLGLVHAMTHSLGGWLGVPHGECNAVLLEHVVAFNCEAAPERYARLGEAMGLCLENAAPAEIKAALTGRLMALRQSVGFTQRLRDLGVRRADFPVLAQHAAADACLVTNPRPASRAEIEELYEAAF